MSAPRIFVDTALTVGTTQKLPDEAFRHVVQVLRMAAGESLSLFNGEGGEYRARLVTVGKREAQVAIEAFDARDCESPLHTVLVQGISKGDRMDWALQKAVELGVSTIAPVITERCNVRLDGERWEKKLEHWRGVIIGACEQSGRTRMPRLMPVMTLPRWLESEPASGLRIVLDPLASAGLRTLACDGQLTAVVGPEGGLSPAEIGLCEHYGYRRVQLGPRVLRTETAGVSVLSAAAVLWGDLGG